jgi:hypothetical protein
MDWFRRLFGFDQEALEKRRQKRRSRKRSRNVRARERELRKNAQAREIKGGKRRVPFFWGSLGVTISLHRTPMFSD